MSTERLLPAERTITVSGETKLHWKDGTVQDLVNNEVARQEPTKEKLKLEMVFNARNLERIARIEIRWTCNIADQLRMKDDDNAVEIFHYASFLRFHQNRCTQLLGRQSPIAQTRTCSIYPPAFVDETIRTLALLLPEHDRNIENWFAGHQAKLQKRQKLLLDPPARECVVGSDSGIHIDSQYAKRCTVPSAILRLSVLQTAQICHRL
ncbi:hypothetical protein OIDMADRAFT_62053 [Oidiodendron maius Zn]|uniref:Uncharacterized protein n=1 Tax=Oidiodendron maius (strain Zn) TaxID=913774 RepID=A0A0C3GMZ8_OIDMZ|nr:hypothetical protein OIDMADRAFT_62053 [Oidiodendron maius Zn]